MMGYADTKQLGSGLRQRLYSRAFIVGDIDNPAERFVYLVLDTQSGDTAIRYGILEGLAGLGPDLFSIHTTECCRDGNAFTFGAWGLVELSASSNYEQRV